MKKYNAYKFSGVEWIGEVPEGWIVGKIKFYANIIMGQSPDGKDITDEGKTPFMQGNAEFTEKYPNPIYYCETCNKHSRIGDVLMSVRAPVGELNLSDKIYGIGRGLCSIKAEQKLSTTFLWYYLMKSKNDFNSFANGSTFTAITVDDLKNFPLILPPPIEQTAIAEYLDAKCGKIDNVVAVQQKRIELLKELKQSIITHAVTKGLDKNAKMKDSGIEWIGEVPERWEVKRLKFLCQEEKYAVKTGPFGTQLKGDDLREDGDVRVYNQRNVIDDQFDSVEFYVTTEKANELNSFYTKPNDLLVTSRGTIGKCSILPNKSAMGILHPCLIAIRLNQMKSNLNYMKYFINESDCFKTNVFLNSNATTIDVIYTDTLKNISIPVPPIQEQTAIVAYLDKKCATIDKQIAKVEKQIELLYEYKQSVITECVTGKRKVC